MSSKLHLITSALSAVLDVPASVIALPTLIVPSGPLCAALNSRVSKDRESDRPATSRRRCTPSMIMIFVFANMLFKLSVVPASADLVLSPAAKAVLSVKLIIVILNVIVRRVRTKLNQVCVRACELVRIVAADR